MTDRVVFDCNVYFQALISPKGPAGQVLQAVARRQLVLYTSNVVLDEFRDVCSRPRLIERFHLRPDEVALFIQSVRSLALTLDNVPAVFEYERDPDDSHYINLAVAADASLIVSRDKDLLALQASENDAAIAFRDRFPSLTILTPTALLLRLKSCSPV